MKTWSCKDLQHSAFLSHSSIKACCKRFFVDGERRGDVVLIDKIASNVTPEDIATAKRDLIERINTGEPTSCSGCPWLEFKEWDRVSDAVKYLSMEHHSVCNLRCTYCSPTYYEGRKPTYDVQKLVEELAPGVRTVVWGGGEPTLGAEFVPLSTLFAAVGVQQRVLSNSVIYSSVVQDMVNNGQIELVTSIDAGTPEMFKKIRGADKLYQVMRNMARYSLHRPDMVTLKYILTEENCASSELKEFAGWVRGYALTDCNFQISCDFRQEEATVDELRAVVELHALLLGTGAECVFIDDLSRIRVTPVANKFAAHRGHDYQDVLVWGTGEQSRRLIKDSVFFKYAVPHVIDSDTYDVLMDRGEPIVIAASQAYPAIFRELKQRGLSNRVIKELIL